MKKIIISLLMLMSFSVEANTYCQNYPDGTTVCTDGVNRWVLTRR